MELDYSKPARQLGIRGVLVLFLLLLNNVGEGGGRGGEETASKQSEIKSKDDCFEIMQQKSERLGHTSFWGGNKKKGCVEKKGRGEVLDLRWRGQGGCEVEKETSG